VRGQFGSRKGYIALMLGFVLRRLGYGLAILVGVNLFTFVLFFSVNTPDDMARLFAVPVSQLGTALSLMELKGIIKQEGGKWQSNLI